MSGSDLMNKFEDIGIIWFLVIGVWVLFYILQAFMAYGTAYRCTKKGNDNGVGLFIYLIGFGFAALIPGLGLHYYIKHLPPKIEVVHQTVQPQVVKIVEQAPAQQVYRQGADVNYNQQPQMQQPQQGNYTPEQIAYMRQQQEQQQINQNRRQ